MGFLGMGSILIWILVLILLWWSGFIVGIFGNWVAFWGGCFEEEAEFGRMRKHIGDLG